MGLAWPRLAARSHHLFITSYCRPALLPFRSFRPSAARCHGNITRPESGTGIKLHFRDSKGQLIKTVEANEGDDILSIAHEHDIDLEGACEGSVACSTCHVILSPEHYDLLPEPEDDENDMLDMAFGLSETSRLGCQVKLTKKLDGMTATLPAATRNMEEANSSLTETRPNGSSSTLEPTFLENYITSYGSSNHLTCTTLGDQVVLKGFLTPPLSST